MNIRSKYLFIVKVALVVMLSLTCAWLLLKELYFSAILAFLVIVAVAISVYNDRKKLIGKMEQMISSIRNSDFSLHFSEKSEKDELARLSKEMDEALQIFRNHTHNAYIDEAETQAWQKLISVLTHEIMNSIAPIISLSDTLSEDTATNALSNEDYRIMKRAMQTIHRRSKGLLTLVENYRELTRLPQPSLQPIHLSSFLSSLQQLTSANNIHFTYSVYPEEMLLMADKEMFEQLLINLLKNAKEACDDQPETKIALKAQQAGNEVQIAVSDNGKGILPEALDKIFIPFYTTKTNGSGIGLSLCRQIVIRHKGKISVKSDETGACFNLQFPA